MLLTLNTHFLTGLIAANNLTGVLIKIFQPVYSLRNHRINADHIHLEDFSLACFKLSASYIDVLTLH